MSTNNKRKYAQISHAESKENDDGDEERDLTPDEEQIVNEHQEESFVAKDHSEYWKKKCQLTKVLTNKICTKIQEGDTAVKERKELVDLLEKTPYVFQKYPEIKRILEGDLSSDKEKDLFCSLITTSNYILDVLVPAMETYMDLSSLCGLSQAEAATVYSTPLGADPKRSRGEENLETTDNDPGVPAKGITPAARAINKLLGSTVSPKIEKSPELEKDDKSDSLGRVKFNSVFSEDNMKEKYLLHDKAIKKVSDVYQSFAQGTKLDAPKGKDASSEYSKSIKETVKLLEECDGTRSDPEGQKFAGPICQEDDGSNPIFRALLNALTKAMIKPAKKCSTKDAAVLTTAKTPSSEKSSTSKTGKDSLRVGNTQICEGTKNPSTTDTPSPQSSDGTLLSENDYESPMKTDSVPQALVEGVISCSGNNRKKRYADIAFTKRGSYAHVFRDDGMELLFELKPGCRKQSGSITLLRELREQGIAHLAKSVIQGLNFSGAGVSTYATIVIGTLAYVEVLRLELFEPGTPKSRLRLFSTNPLPLMDEKSISSWYGTKLTTAQNDEVDQLKKLLYNGTESLKKDVPLGIKALATCIAARRKDLFGQPWSRVTSNQLGEMLGTGTFGMVFAHGENDNHVIKVSRFGRIESIKTEATVLNHLKSKMEGHKIDVLPDFQDWGYLAVTIGGTVHLTPYVRTSPKGLSLLSLKGESADEWNSVIRSTRRDIKQALEFVHKHDIFHGDVNDRNIVIKRTERGFRAILVDFGNARSIGKKMTRFHGTPAFAHKDIHLKRLWYCESSYDFTSLGFTIVTLLNGCAVAWKGLSSKPGASKGDWVFDERQKTAVDILEKHSKVLGDDKSEVEGWLKTTVTPHSAEVKLRIEELEQPPRNRSEASTKCTAKPSSCSTIEPA